MVAATVAEDIMVNPAGLLVWAPAWDLAVALGAVEGALLVAAAAASAAASAVAAPLAPPEPERPRVSLHLNFLSPRLHLVDHILSSPSFSFSRIRRHYKEVMQAEWGRMHVFVFS